MFLAKHYLIIDLSHLVRCFFHILFNSTPRRKKSTKEQPSRTSEKPVELLTSFPPNARTSTIHFLSFLPPFSPSPIFFHPLSLSLSLSVTEKVQSIAHVSPHSSREKKVPHESIKREGREVEYVNCANKHLMESYQLFPQKSPVEEGRRQEKIRLRPLRLTFPSRFFGRHGWREGLFSRRSKNSRTRWSLSSRLISFSSLLV